MSLFHTRNPCTAAYCSYCDPIPGSADTIMTISHCPNKTTYNFITTDVPKEKIAKQRIRNKTLLSFDPKERKRNRWR